MAKRGVQSSGAGRFDAFALAARGESLGGEVDVARRARLSDRLAPTARPVPIAWTIEGGHDGAGRPILTVTIKGTLPVVCQRCLQEFDLAVAQQTMLLLARSEAEVGPLDDGETEVVLAAAPLDAMTLVEDEVLLSLPFAPSHAEAQCPAGWKQAAEAQPAAVAKASPFARLAALKKRPDGLIEE